MAHEYINSSPHAVAEVIESIKTNISHHESLLTSNTDSKQSLSSEATTESIMNTLNELESFKAGISVSKLEISIGPSNILEKNNVPTVNIPIISMLNNVDANENKVEVNDVQEISAEMQNSISQQNGILGTESSLKESTSFKPRIASEEEAKAALAEKRRLAREQAERDAELQRQKQEEIRRKEEEQIRLEELNQQRMEEEHIRLAELHRQIEEEKLQKAIEEQNQREKEEMKRRDEESRQKLEREEYERKNREETERQRVELQEKLKKEEEERAERKRRVEQIMARTRGKSSQTVNNIQDNCQNNASVKDESGNKIDGTMNNLPNDYTESDDNIKTLSVTSGPLQSRIALNSIDNSTKESQVENFNSLSVFNETKTSQKTPLPDLVDLETCTDMSLAKISLQEENGEKASINASVINSFPLSSNNIANDVRSPLHTNGYSSHEEMSCTTSPEDTSDVGLLIDISNNDQSCVRGSSESADFSKEVDLKESNFNNDNYLINVDNMNSNLVNSGNSFIDFDDSLKKRQETPISDLLS